MYMLRLSASLRLIPWKIGVQVLSFHFLNFLKNIVRDAGELIGPQVVDRRIYFTFVTLSVASGVNRERIHRLLEIKVLSPVFQCPSQRLPGRWASAELEVPFVSIPLRAYK